MNKVLFIKGMIILVALSGFLLGYAAESGSSSASQMTVVNKQAIEIEGADILSMSPNGKWFVVVGEEFCIYSVSMLTEHLCFPFSDDPPFSRRWDWLRGLKLVHWSPQGTRIAFSAGVDNSDLWVLEVESGTLTNLTEEALDNNGVDAERPLFYDRYPNWTADGQALVFTRAYGENDEQINGIYQILLQSRKVKKLVDVPIGWSVRLPFWDGGEQVFYSVYSDTKEARGIWVYDIAERETQKILGQHAQMGPPSLVEVDAQSKTGIISYMSAMRGSIHSKPSYFALLALDTGEVSPLYKGHDVSPDFEPVVWQATFSPDGARVLYFLGGMQVHEHTAVIRKLDDGSESYLYRNEGWGPVSWQQPQWASNNTVLIPAEDMLLLLKETTPHVSTGSPTMIYWFDVDTRKIQRTKLSFTSAVQDLVTDLSYYGGGIALDDTNSQLYWASGTKIQRANLDGSGIETLLNDPSGPEAIALDLVNERIYWTNRAGTIQRANLDGSNVEELVTGLLLPRGIALDLPEGKMYWTDQSEDRILRASLDGSDIEVLVTSVDNPQGIALDLANGKMYWTDWGQEKIQRANLDGSDIEDLVTTGLVAPRGIALDLNRGKMYWTDLGRDLIQRANLDGSFIEDIVPRGLVSPLGIALGN